MDQRATHRPGVHLISGAIGGSVGAIVTCPLDVVKTRLQSRNSTFATHAPARALPAPVPASGVFDRALLRTTAHSNNFGISVPVTSRPPRVSIMDCFRQIVRNEGPFALFKGLGPNLVGVAPSRAIYFYCYSLTKSIYQESVTLNHKLVYMLSAGTSGFITSTITNPIWFLRTRIQLDQQVAGTMTVGRCIRETYNRAGLRGFYHGMTASYAGISETMLHFMLYETFKEQIAQRLGVGVCGGGVQSSSTCIGDMYYYMGAAACSKTTAAILAYPHEVARTRMREDSSKYRRFFQTLRTVAMDEGVFALYRGLYTHLLRSIPNTAIMMGTYELCLFLMYDQGPQRHGNHC